MHNPDKNYIPSKGVDLPIMYVYMAGRIAGDCIDECLEWRHKLVNAYANYKGNGVYPISFLDALNSKEADSIDEKGLSSALPPNLIYDKDLLSVKKADVIVANMNDYMETPIETSLYRHHDFTNEETLDHYLKLKRAIINRRPNYGTICEVAWALLLNKPLILIAGGYNDYTTLEKHPFTKRASVIVIDVEQLIRQKHLNILYKSISGATY